MSKNTFLHRAVPFVAALALGGGIGAGIYAGVSGGGSSGTPATTAAPATTVQPAAAKTTTSNLNQIYKTATPGVVDITVSETTSGGFGLGQQQSQAEGTGFVYDTKGDIVTAAHVVDGSGPPGEVAEAIVEELRWSA